MTSNPPERLSAALADRYRIERELGQGGMATVSPYPSVDRGEAWRGHCQSIAFKLSLVHGS